MNRELGYTLVSAAITAAILYTVVPLWMVMLGLVILFTHEFGHYLYARAVGGEPALPFLLPLGPLVWGVTRVRRWKTLSPLIRYRILRSGKGAGVTVITTLLVFAWSIGNSSVVWALGMALVFEFSSDWRRLRKERHALFLGGIPL